MSAEDPGELRADLVFRDHGVVISENYNQAIQKRRDRRGTDRPFTGHR